MKHRWMSLRGCLLVAMVFGIGLVLAGCPGGTGGSTTGTVRGTVTDDTGTQLVSGARVFLEQDADQTALSESLTDAQGAFVFDSVPLGQMLHVRAFSFAYGEGASTSFALTADARERVVTVSLQDTGPPPPPI